MINLEQVVSKVESWVREVGAVQLEKLKQKNWKITSKSSAIDLVTDVDRQSEILLVSKIKTAFPEHSILAEESGIHERASEYRWVIDPIDGTTNYSHGFPIFCISVALQYKEESVVGVVYVPALGELFSATKGKGAFLNGERLQVSETTELGQALLATGFPYDRATDPENNVKYFNQMITQVQGIRRVGCAAFDLCNVAAGRFDGYWELKLKLWDIAAGILLVTEAGGKITYLDKQREKGIALIAGNVGINLVIENELRAADCN